jgi:hypothetical protein
MEIRRAYAKDFRNIHLQSVGQRMNLARGRKN